MTQCIHYEDNIFMVLDLLKHIERGLKLDIDEDYFGEKIVSDLLFAETGLQRLFLALKESTLQLDKDQYFRLLFKTMELFTSIGEQIVNSETGRSINFSGLVPRLKESIAVKKESMDEIKNLLNTDSDSEENADQISQEEMTFLMTDTEDNDEANR